MKCDKCLLKELLTIARRSHSTNQYNPYTFDEINPSLVSSIERSINDVKEGNQLPCCKAQG